MIASRRKFLTDGCVLVAGISLPSLVRARFDLSLADLSSTEDKIFTVTGPVKKSALGFTLSHEHVLVDFVGAAQVSKSRYRQEDVFEKALPYLVAAKKRGCRTLVDCTPAYLGRDVEVLKRLSIASGIQIITNTGYYGASKEKYFPEHAFKETAEQLAARWIAEWNNGIADTDVKPGFIKSGVDGFPLTATQEKVIAAAAITHLETGLTIAIHTGSGAAAVREMEIIKDHGVHPSAWIWIHAQNESDRSIHYEAAKAGGWISFDGFNKTELSKYITFLSDMRAAKLLDRVLISHDAGWYHVGEVDGGGFTDYNAIMDVLLPGLRSKGFTEAEIKLIFEKNPADAFAIGKRLSRK